jgi:hypothetical protein
MASTDIENKTEENITVSPDQQTSTLKSAPIFDASSHHEHSQTCTDPSHNHDFPSFFDQNDLYSSLAGTKKDVQVKRKNKKNQKQTAVRAETIPGNRGNENIDDLVNFINNTSSNSDKKPKKKSTTTN